MYRLGSAPTHTREMVLDDIFRERIELLILMARNFTQGVPLGDYQRRAMEKNAIHIEIECHSFVEQSGFQQPRSRNDMGRYLFARLKLLAMMIKAVAKGAPMGAYRKKAIRENLNAVAHLLQSDLQINEYLKAV